MCRNGPLPRPKAAVKTHGWFATCACLSSKARLGPELRAKKRPRPELAPACSQEFVRSRQKARQRAFRGAGPGASCQEFPSGIFGLEDLAPAIHPALQVDVVRSAKLARVLVLDIGRPGERIRGAALAALHARSLSFRNSHEVLQEPFTRPLCGIGPPVAVKRNREWGRYTN